MPWWREAHRLYPGNWTYKRQAWTFVTTAEGATENDLMQGPNDVYEGNWLDDVIAVGWRRGLHGAAAALGTSAPVSAVAQPADRVASNQATPKSTISRMRHETISPMPSGTRVSRPVACANAAPSAVKSSAS